MHVTFVFQAEFLRHRLYGELSTHRGMKEIRFLQKRGHKISAVFWIKQSTDLPETEVLKGIEIQRIFMVPPLNSPLKRFMAYRRITREVEDKIVSLKPDAIICHDLELLRAGVRAKERLAVPLFYDAHEDYPAMVSENSRLEALAFYFIERSLVRHVDHTYTVCEPIADKFRKWKAPVTVLYNSRPMEGAPTSGNEESIQKKREIGFADGDFILGFIGNLTRESNLESLIEIITELPSDIKLMLIGGPKERIEELRKQVKKYGVENRVHFQGPVSTEEVLDHVSVFDVGLALLPQHSKNYLQRSPNKLFEYMMVGIPQIVSDFPNMRNLVVEDCSAGLAVDPMDRKAIIESVTILYEDHAKRKEMGENARRCMEEKYSWEKQEEKLARSHPVFGE